MLNDENQYNLTLRISVVLFLSLFLSILFYHNLDLLFAYKGFGPEDYVNQKMFPLNFNKDFLGTLMGKHYDRSIAMWPFLYAYKFLGISPTIFSFFHLLVQTFFAIFSILVLLKTINIDFKYAIGIIIPILLFEWIAGVNIGRFNKGWGHSLYLPLYYASAKSFGLLGINYFIKKNYKIMFIFLSISFMCHVTIGTFITFFICCNLFIRKETFLNKNFWIGLISFILVGIAHLVTNVKLNLTTVSAGKLDVADWIKLTKMFCFHWYPIAMEMFTTNTKEILLLLTSLSMLIFSYKHNKILSKHFVPGIVGCLILLPMGIFFSEFYPIPTIIKISPQRATSLVSFFSVFIFLVHMTDSLKSNCKSSQLCSTFILVFLVIPIDINIKSASIILIMIGGKLLGEKKCFLSRLTFITPVWPLILILWGTGFCGVYFTVIKRVDVDIASSFKEAQEWAKINTSKGSLFMVDPTKAYAWRDYSARSSFGTFRDWGFLGLAYDASYDRFLEGSRRSKIFGVDFSKITKEEIEKNRAPIFRKYNKIIRRSYYSFNIKKLKKLSITEGVDYFVFEKIYSKSFILNSTQNVFENTHFLIIKI